LIIWLIQQLISAKANERSLERENSKLKEGYAVADKEIAAFQEKIYKYTQRESILSNYEHLDKIGVFKHKTSGSYYCHKCLIDKTLESPLKTLNDGWRCNTCDKYYSNPDYKSPMRESHRPNYSF